MEIRLIKNRGEKPVVITKSQPVTIEELVEEYMDDIEFKPMMAKVNGSWSSLTKVIRKDARVELVDARAQSGNLVYQHTLTMIFLKAVKNVLGNVDVQVLNPLNKGLFVRIDDGRQLLDSQVATISGLMEEYIRRDLPIEEKLLPRQEAIQLLEELGYLDKAELIRQESKVKRVALHYLGDYVNSFYGVLAPSTGYVDTFELAKYDDGLILRHPYTDKPNVLPEYRDDTKLHQAFQESEEWNKLLGVRYLSDLNRIVESGEARDLILLSEALHEKKIAGIADMIKTRGKRIVLIAGPSSSGKTSFAKRLCIQLRVNGIQPLYMGTDDYFVERDKTPVGPDGNPDFENLGAMDVELFNSNMNDLLAGKEVDMPTFDFITGRKIFGQRITRMDENMVMVIEGIHALNEAMSSQIDEGDKFKIYISPLTQLNMDVHNRISTTDARKLRRMVRDFKFRNHSAEKTIDEWPKVRAGEDKNIFPYNGEADVLFNSVHVYELAVLKKYAQPLLEAVSEDAPQYGEAQRLVQFLKYFKALEDEKSIPCNSILREFIGGSVLLED